MRNATAISFLAKLKEEDLVLIFELLLFGMLALGVLRLRLPLRLRRGGRGPAAAP